MLKASGGGISIGLRNIHIFGVWSLFYKTPFEKSQKPLTRVSKGKLDLSDRHHRNWLNSSLHQRETLTNSKNSMQVVGSTLSGSLDKMSLSYLKSYSNSF
jgi:hypothetical protein